MLALTPRFTILATFCSLAAVSLSPMSTVAIAVNPRHSETKDTTTPVHHQKHPTVPLPAALLRKSKSAAAKKGAKKASASAGEKHKSDVRRFKVREYDFADSVAVEPRHHGRYKKIIIDSKHGIRVGRDHHSNSRREREQVIVKGKDAHIHVEDHDRNWRHGEKIIIKGDNAHVHGRRSIVIPQADGPQATFKVRRDEQAAPVPGTVLIMSPVDNSSDREIAALYMDTSTDEYVLNASDTQRTALSVAKASISSSQNSEDDVTVFLQTLISSKSSSAPVQHCATYDPNPAQAEPMKMTPCDNTTTADAHRSQVFAYNERTGVIRPMTLLEDEGPNNATSSSAPSNDDNSWNSTTASNGTTSSNSTAPSNDTTSAAAADSTPRTSGRIDAALTGFQDVVLKFVPDDVTVNDTQDPASNGTSTTTATVTVTNTASASTQSLSAADVTSATDEPVSSTLSSGTLTASTASVSSTIDGVSPSSTSAGALKIEVISPSDSSASTTPSTTSASSTTVASSSVDAAAVASSIAASNAAASSSSTINASSSPTSAPTTVAVSGRD